MAKVCVPCKPTPWVWHGKLLGGVGVALALFFVWCHFNEVNSEHGLSYEQCAKYVSRMDKMPDFNAATSKVNSYDACLDMTKQWPVTRSFVKIGKGLEGAIGGIVVAVVQWFSDRITAFLSALFGTFQSMALFLVVAALAALLMIVRTGLSRFNAISTERSTLPGYHVRTYQSEKPVTTTLYDLLKND